MTRSAKLTAVPLGFVLGAILGLTSVGSGALIGLALILVFKLTPQRVVGTDVFHAAGLLWVAGLMHMLFGNVDYGLMVNILIGSLPGVWIGTNLMSRVPTGRPADRPGYRAVRLGVRRSCRRRARTIGLGVVIGVPIAMGFISFFIYRATQPRPRDAQTTS